MTSAAAAPSPYISPVSALSVLDHYMRREAGQDEIVGSMMGYTSEDGSRVFIKTCFPMPCKAGQVDIKFHQTLFDLHRKVYPNDQLLGWYHNGALDAQRARDIQTQYAREMKQGDPLVLVVDTGLRTETWPFHVLKSTKGDPVRLSCPLLPAEPDQQYLSLLASSQYEPVPLGRTVHWADAFARARALSGQGARTDPLKDMTDVLLLKRLKDTLQAYTSALGERTSSAEKTRQDLMMVKHLTGLYAAQLECGKKLC